MWQSIDLSAGHRSQQSRLSYRFTTIFNPQMLVFSPLPAYHDFPNQYLLAQLPQASQSTASDNSLVSRLAYAMHM